MSEERFDRLENQLSQVIQSISVMQQNISGLDQKVSGLDQKVSSLDQKVSSLDQKVSAMQNNVDALREDMISLRNRVDSNEGTLIVAIREGFRRQEDFINDLNIDLAANERKTRRLSRRVDRLERLDRDY